jgi:DNA mismatch repair protein MutS2
LTYPENIEHKLGFDKIRESLRNSCLSVLGSELVDQMEFSDDFGFIQSALNETNEFVIICQFEENFPLDNYIDCRASLKRIKTPGLYMEEKELHALRLAMQALSAIQTFFKKRSEEEKYPWLNQRFAGMIVFPYVIKSIEKILDESGTMKDNASPELAEIRQQINNKQKQVSRKAQTLLKSYIGRGFVDEEAGVTIRDGRPVIPVRSTYKRQVKGFIYDESSTGQTTFIEPEEVVELNNDIRELLSAERREIIKILSAVSDQLRPDLAELHDSFKYMGEVDFIRAKAKYAIKLNAKLCNLEKRPAMTWYNAIHPLLYLAHKKSGKQIVPQDILLNDENRILVISGPNAGGKSVCLQTAGLLQYMLQCGMLIPVNEDSTAGMFENIFIAMGDEQSIDNDLSTYSSHLLSLKLFSKKSDKQTLILIDEFGTGTEPMLGGAIAEAVLERLNRQKAYGVITTHYTNLKHYAEETHGIINGAMLYDTHKLEPLFKLEIGKPGSSFAFEIARKIGLPEEILQSATDKIGEEHINYDKHLKDIIRDKRYWENKRASIRSNEKKLESVVEKYKKDLEDIQKQRKEILDNAKKEAEGILSGANKAIENTIREIKEAEAEKEKTKAARKKFEDFKEKSLQEEQEDIRIKRKMEKIKQREKRKKEKQKDLGKEEAAEKKSEKEPIQKGDAVKMHDQDSIGEVIDIKGKNYTVAFGQLITTLNINKIERVSKNEAKRARKNVTTRSNNMPGFDVSERKLNFKPQIDVRGKRGDEAISTIRDFVDEAIMAGINELTILHGKGNGILRQVIRDYLKTVDVVSDARDAHIEMGGAGITIVHLDF